MYVCMDSCRRISVFTMMITTIDMYVCMDSCRRISVFTMIVTTIDMYVDDNDN